MSMRAEDFPGGYAVCFPNGDVLMLSPRGWTPARLDPRREVRNYAAGFDWGRLTDGTRQLALALLCWWLDDPDEAPGLAEELAEELAERGEPGRRMLFTMRDLRAWLVRRYGNGADLALSPLAE